MLTQYLSGLPAFLMYFGLSLLFLLVFKFIYTRVTPHDEWHLVKEEKNSAAAIALAGAFLGYALAIGGAASNAVNLIDFALWGVIALVAQIVAFAIIRFGFMPKLVERIKNNELPAAIIMASMSLAVGILNAACMTY
ncbi:DUF350 domain-containing protein [Thaumasiovibrio sp. DFM-14]|uniref:DUF350 domain-containing protein n=1 Tax=Thaumasiovibrio sp. DFM-14 TaxID=3384792 RepID=UPI0039A14549